MLTYGSESWNLTPDVQRVINGANSRMVSIVTGRTQKEEATAGTRSFDIVRAIRARRLQWLGQILRMDPDRLLIKAVQLMYDTRAERDILSDAPITDTWAELKAWAADEKKWRQRVYTTRHGNGVSIKYQSLFVPEQEFKFTISTQWERKI